MKLLWLNAGLLLPLDKGGKLRTWHVMRHLAARHDITYLSFQDSTQTAADRDGMRAVCARLETVPRTDAAVQAGRTAATAMAGTVIMLAVAGLLEGVGRQTINNDAMRMLIGSAAFVGWLAYFYAWPARRAARGE